MLTIDSATRTDSAHQNSGSRGFDPESLLNASAFVQSWRARRRDACARIVAHIGVVLYTVMTVVDVHYGKWLFVGIDLIALAGSLWGLWMVYGPRHRATHAWMPLYAVVWLTSFPNIGATGGLTSPQLGPYLALLFGLGLLMQSRFGLRWLVGGVAATYGFWIGLAAYNEGLTALAERGDVVVGLSLLILSTLTFYPLMAHSERQLSRMVVEANRQLVDERLRAARASEANAAKTAFLINVSHELRTPLTAMLGFAELTADPRLDPATRVTCHDAIERNGQQLLGLINDLIALAQAGSAALRIEPRPADIRGVIEDVVATFEPQARPKGIKIVTTIGAGTPASVLTDEQRARQVLATLMSNAIKFTDGGEVGVRVDMRERGEGQDPVLDIRISDTGRGIATKDRRRLFRIFSQVDDSLSRMAGGVGIGLALARELAGLLGGDVLIDRSEPGAGSTFRFVLPVGARA